MLKAENNHIAVNAIHCKKLSRIESLKNNKQLLTSTYLLYIRCPPLHEHVILETNA